eukprot:g31078.t1
MISSGYVEQTLFRSYTGTVPHPFLRYIDDCIGAASCSHEELEQFINFTHIFHPNLKFTWTISDTSLPFLDISVPISAPLSPPDKLSKSDRDSPVRPPTWSIVPILPDVVSSTSLSPSTDSVTNLKSICA